MCREGVHVTLTDVDQLLVADAALMTLIVNSSGTQSSGQLDPATCVGSTSTRMSSAHVFPLEEARPRGCGRLGAEGPLQTSKADGHGNLRGAPVSAPSHAPLPQHIPSGVAPPLSEQLFTLIPPSTHVGHIGRACGWSVRG